MLPLASGKWGKRFKLPDGYDLPFLTDLKLLQFFENLLRLESSILNQSG